MFAETSGLFFPAIDKGRIDPLESHKIHITKRGFFWWAHKESNGFTNHLTLLSNNFAMGRGYQQNYQR